jgi:HlyD family secretion protein
MNNKLLYFGFRRRNQLLVATVACVSLAAFGAWNAPGNSSETVSVSTLEVAAVTRAPFREQINIRGVYVPEQSVYLDAVEGGRVEELLVEEGQLVSKGQPLLVLSNTGLQLDAISREAQVSEQLNNLQNTQLAIEQNALKLKQDLANFDYRINQFERKHQQNKILLGKNLISKEQFDEIKDELEYLRSARKLTIESQSIDNRLREIQLKQLAGSAEQLNKNLVFARKNLENLIVKAPIDGQLSSFNVELGESKSQGERLGQVDNLQSFKIQAKIDEFYLNNVYVGQLGVTYIKDELIKVSVGKIYSQVDSGKFKVELKFQQALNTKMRRGQNLTVELGLSDEVDVLQLPLGGFVQDTGGQWAFVITDDGAKAERRAITLGRENGTSVEVLKGLSVGESVIISPYRDLANVSIINFDFDS